MHRFILSAPKGMDVDHVDGDGLNNTREILRLATRQQNMWNHTRKRKGCTSQYKSVRLVVGNHKYRCWYWRAEITRDGKPTHLGCFQEGVKAAVACDKAAREMFGEFAASNFPEDITT